MTKEVGKNKKLEIVNKKIEYIKREPMSADYKSNNQALAAARRKNFTEVKNLIEKDLVDINATRGKYKYNMLHFAVYYKNLEMIEFLLQHGADPNAMDAVGNTPLHIATLLKSDEGIDEVVGKMAKCLIDHGANIVTLNRHRHTPYQCTVKTGKIGLAEYLRLKQEERGLENANQDFNKMSIKQYCQNIK